MIISSFLTKILITPHFFANEMGILSVDRDKIKRDNVNFYDDPETIIQVRLLAWCNELEICKAYKKDLSKEFIPVAITRWWDWCLLEDEKKK